MWQSASVRRLQKNWGKTMRKKLTCLISLLLIISLMGCGNSATKAEFKTGSVGNIEFSNVQATVKYDSHEFTTTKFGTDIIVITFTFTNHDDDYLCMNKAAYFCAYQDGMQLDGMQLDTEFGDNGWREIAKDKSLSCSIAFKVSGKSDVQLRVSQVIDGSFNGSKYQEQILSFIN